MIHGTISGYTNGRCHCDACRLAWNTYRRAYYHDSPRTVDVRPVLAYLRALLAAGHTHTSIAALAGIARQTVGRITQGHRRSVRRVTAEAIMGVALDELREGQKVPIERVQILIAKLRQAGVSQGRVCRIAGLKHHGFAGQIAVQWRTWRRIGVVTRMAVQQGIVAPDVLDCLD